MRFNSLHLTAGEDARVLSPGSGGVICINAHRNPGQVVMEFNSEGMFRGWASLHRGSGDSSGEEVPLVNRRAQVGIWEELVDVDLNAYGRIVGEN